MRPSRVCSPFLHNRALLPLPIDTNTHLGAFEDFIDDFKMSPQEMMTYNLGNVTIDDDDLSDEYDFMDEDEQAEQRRAQDKVRKRAPRHKYKDMLQDIADRKINEVVIDLR